MESPPVVASGKSLRLKVVGAIVVAILAFASFYAVATYQDYHLFSSETNLSEVVVSCNGITNYSACFPVRNITVDFSTPNGASILEINLRFSSWQGPSPLPRVEASQLTVDSGVSTSGNFILQSVGITYQEDRQYLVDFNAWPSIYIEAAYCGNGPTSSCPTVYSSLATGWAYLKSNAPFPTNSRGTSDYSGTEFLLNWPGVMNPNYIGGRRYDTADPLGFILNYLIHISVPDAGSGPFSLAKSYVGNVTIPLYLDSGYNVSMRECGLNTNLYFDCS